MLKSLIKLLKFLLRLQFKALEMPMRYQFILHENILTNHPICLFLVSFLRTFDSLKDSNMSPKQKTPEGQRIGAHFLARSTLEG